MRAKNKLIISHISNQYREKFCLTIYIVTKYIKKVGFIAVGIFKMKQSRPFF